jgi:RND family efflux transporter MFP subunit
MSIDMGAERAASALIMVLAALSLAGCHRKAELSPAKEQTSTSVRVQTAERKSHFATEDVVGTVRAKLHAAIEAKASGRIEKMLVAPGQSVKAGELLVQLDPREIQARLDQALALRDQHGRDAERLRRLLAENAVSRQEFETVESRHRIAVASVAEAETMLGYARIVAPFAGVISRKLTDVGDLASPGRALLEMDDPSALRLEADVPESLLKRIQFGAKLSVRVSSEDATIEGVVSEIAPVADPVSRTFNVKLDLPSSAGLRAGQFARVTVPVAESKALRVPASAIVQRGQMELVFVVVARRAQLRLVKSGKTIGDEIELVSGVSAGEQVVIEGATQLRDGQPVEVGP